jgi:hypothetical protein
MPKKGEIAGLSGWHYVATGGKGFKGRHAENYLTGEALSVRKAQERAHGGVRYEERRPVEQRKTYKRSIGKYYRYGPFPTEQAVHDFIPSQGTGYLQAYGLVVRGSGSIGKKQYHNISGLTDMDNLKISLQNLSKPKTLTERRLVENISHYATVERYYVFIRKA